MASSRALIAIPLVLALPAPVQTAPPANATFSVSVTVASPCRLDADGSVAAALGCMPVSTRTQGVAVAGATSEPRASEARSGHNRERPGPATALPKTVLIRF